MTGRAKGHLSCSSSLPVSVMKLGTTLTEGPQCLCLMGNLNFGLKQRLAVPLTRKGVWVGLVC